MKNQLAEIFKKFIRQNQYSLGKIYFLNAFFEELFHTVASTKSNDLKILMIMKNCKQTNVTYSEFAKQTFFWKKGYSTIIWGGNKVTLQNVSFLAVFSFDNLSFLWDTCIKQSEYENWGPVTQLFFLTYAGIQCTQEKNVIRWRYGFYWALLLVLYFY